MTYFENEIYKYKGNIKLFIDMDGVIADYVVGDLDYKTKRPLFNNIKMLESISKLNNIDLYILSISKDNQGVIDKNYWLDKYIPFINKDKRIIISREANNMEKSSILKSNYLNNFNSDSIIILIDDDPRVLKEINKNNPNIILYKDTIFMD